MAKIEAFFVSMLPIGSLLSGKDKDTLVKEALSVPIPPGFTDTDIVSVLTALFGMHKSQERYGIVVRGLGGKLNDRVLIQAVKTYVKQIIEIFGLSVLIDSLVSQKMMLYRPAHWLTLKKGCQGTGGDTSQETDDIPYDSDDYENICDQCHCCEGHCGNYVEKKKVNKSRKCIDPDMGWCVLVMSPSSMGQLLWKPKDKPTSAVSRYDITFVAASDTKDARFFLPKRIVPSPTCGADKLRRSAIKVITSVELSNASLLDTISYLPTEVRDTTLKRLQGRFPREFSKPK